MILFFDAETTGLPDRYTPLNSDRRPHCMQLAALLTGDDGTERALSTSAKCCQEKAND